MKVRLPVNLILIFFAVVGLISANENRILGAPINTNNPLLDQIMKQKAQERQEAVNDQTSEIPEGEEQLVPIQDEMTMQSPDTTQPVNTEKYKLNVRLDQITVHNAHEGFASGDGEYALSAYMHGILVDLTKLSKWRDSGLWDVSDGETVRFAPGTVIPVNIDSSLPFIILTFGQEQDKCPLPGYPVNIQSEYLNVLANETAKALGADNGTQQASGSGMSTAGAAGAAAGTAIGNAYGGPVGGMIGSAVGNFVGEKVVGAAYDKIACSVNSNENLGTIEETYVPPSFGTGTHSVKSSSGDYTLTYTIAATRVQ